MKKNLQAMSIILGKVDNGTLVVTAMLAVILLFGALNSLGVVKY